MRLLTKTAGAVAIVAAFGLIGGQAAQAETTLNPAFTTTTGVDTESFTATVPATGTDYLTNFAIPQFNPSLGNLTSIVLTYSATATGTGSVTNNSTNSAATFVSITQNSLITDNPAQNIPNGGGSQVTTGTANGDSFLVFTTTAFPGAAIGTLAAGASSGPVTLTGGTFTPISLSQTSGFDTNLIGLGTFTIQTATGEYTTFGGTGGNLSALATTLDAQSLEVTYNYAPPTVPEPGSLSLLGAGLFGLGAVIRRRRRV